MKIKKNVDFGALITDAIKTAQIKKSDVVAESGISRSSFYRAISKSGKVSKPNVVALVRSINKLAKKSVVDESEALERAGFDALLHNPMTIEIETGVQLLVEKSKFSKKRLSSLTENLRSAYEMSLRSSAPKVTQQPKKAERKVKLIKKGAERRSV